MHRRRRLAAALVALALFPAVTASGAEEDPDRPGLPYQGPAQWNGVGTQGVTEATKAKQWLRLPAMELAAYVLPQPRRPRDTSCTQHPPYSNLRDWEANTFLKSGTGSYGTSPRFTVRSVAFGAVPVEVTLRLEQERDSDDLPVPWFITAPYHEFCAGRGPHAAPGQFENHAPPAKLTGSFRLRVDELRVDGVELSLASLCRTAPTQISLTSREWFSQDPGLRDGERGGGPDWDADTTRYYLSAEGGLLEGRVDIPAFSGCVTQDDDLDALLTGLISSEDNPVTIRQEYLTTACGPEPEPGSVCPMPSPMPLPTKDD